MTEALLPYTRAPDLPLFQRPPVTEVSLGINFQPVALRAIHLGRLHERFAGRYPVVEEHPPVAAQIERFGRGPQSMIEFQLLDRPPLPMVVFLAEDRSSLIQVQGDRFYCAWRRVEADTPYPRYSILREDFIRNATAFAQFASDADLPDIPVVQAEMTYVNDLTLGDLPQPAKLAEVLSVLQPWAGGTGQSPDTEDISVTQRFVFKNGDGVECARLHVIAEPLVTESDAMLRLSLIYRGEPHTRFPEMNPGLPAIMRFLDDGHDQVVRTFANVTTPEAHKAWGMVR
jgi:uncharacterized protein (TIGR04255 family)